MLFVRNKIGTLSGIGNIDVSIPGTRHKTIQLIFNGAVATAKIFGSVDGVNFVQIGSDISASALISDSTLLTSLRVSLSAYTSGSVEVWLGYLSGR